MLYPALDPFVLLYFVFAFHRSPDRRGPLYFSVPFQGMLACCDHGNWPRPSIGFQGEVETTGVFYVSRQQQQQQQRNTAAAFFFFSKYFLKCPISSCDACLHFSSRELLSYISLPSSTTNDVQFWNFTWGCNQGRPMYAGGRASFVAFLGRRNKEGGHACLNTYWT